MWVFFYTLFGVFVVTLCHQRVAPGVPPSQYIPNQNQQGVPAHQHAPPVHQQQMHQQPIQQQVPIHQQMPVHQQQQVPQMHQVPLQPVPQQHMQQQHMQQQQQQQQQQHIPQQHQQVPMQQVPVQQGHQAHHPQQILNAANMAHEKEHIQEHLDIPMDTSKMSEQELQFHYFKMHDADNNNKLDGCELIKSLIHWHEQGHQDPNSPTPTGEKVFKDDELVQLIDPILGMDDGNNDGFIDYPEFVQAQQKAAATAGQQQPHQ